VRVLVPVQVLQGLIIGPLQLQNRFSFEGAKPGSYIPL